ncbi:protein translocase subunit SecD [Leucobacter sp. UT-8R-CII-1-4]|uniref:protein translocase subunit SecD n=1 Tax=Leucobacter sp. UT-8R-CII-1-4 TaxID=3040075 RepID=UPI0024A8CA32|nr:protein translocase subunit SecD [Leucobacter sp. UT-8R-CII-1-4]MDI6024181.1 protein translocase subunit SecD [Leucobacter sp. UT-8R-CII-1-4]
MAQSPAVKRATRSLTTLLVIIVALVGVIALGAWRSDATWTPKLALDLQGGTQIILAPKLTDGQAVTGEQLSQAVEIIRQRVDASGVSEAEITTQGSQNISVSIPGKADDATLQRIEASAKLDFRPVLYMGVNNAQPGQPAEGDQATAQGEAGTDAENAEAPAADGTEEAPATDAPADTSADGTADTANVDPPTLPKNAYDQAWITEGLMQKFNDFSCTADETLGLSDAPTDRPLITCDESGLYKYVLGPVEMGGETITDATAQIGSTSSGASTGQWVVQITLDKAGTKTFGEISTRMYGKPEPQNMFAFVLDSTVISAPTMNGLILDGRPSISGNFTQESAQVLANQLKFGALPIGFTVQSQEDISATLGASQLQQGLLAGLIGLVLVVIYSLFQYRALGTLTIASLIIAGVLTYLMLTLLSWRQGYRLSLAGVAGVIVAVGITADSFIVYFERIRDALRDGFSLDRAVEHGWKKAIRTVLASDGINFLAAAILFILAVGSVRGFAFTLGLTTLVDIAVVVLFTHPMMTLLSRTKFYSEGHRFSGLDPRQLGAVYRGRAQFREPVVASRGSNKKTLGSQREAAKRQTIAERKAAETAGKES